MKICCSIAPASMAEAFSAIQLAAEKTGLIEIRIDGISDLDLPALLRKPRPAFIITNRMRSEGGTFDGTTKEQFYILSEAARLGAEYIDVEFCCGVPVIRKLLSASRKTKVIVSHHNFDKTPANVVSLYNRMKATGAHIVKIAAMANDITDTETMFDLLTIAKKEKQPAIAISMGERGEISRLLQGKFNGFLTYAPLDAGAATAPGQRSISDLINIFRVPILRSRTKVFGLIGNPVSHSKGIYFHNQVFARRKLNAVYVNFLVDDLPGFIYTFRDLAQGFSVTMPYKQAAVPLLDVTEPIISELKAVNTIIKRNNKLVGMNIDFLAIVACLKQRGTLKGKKITILGAGATARTMAYAASVNGATITIIGRDSSKARILAEELGGSWKTPDMVPELQTDILINATSVGMNSENEIPFTIQKYLHRNMIVFDAVYTPPMTALLLAAQKAGCALISGLELFQTQAKLQSRIFMNAI